MATPGETILKLIKSHVSNDDPAFYAAVKRYITEERRKNHHIIARELERALGSTQPAPPSAIGSFTMLQGSPSDAPRDKERGALLIELSEPRKELSDLVLSHKVRHHLERILLENREADVLRSHGLRPMSRILFCGPPGCGKSVAAEALARELYLPLALVRFDAVVSSYLGETAANLRSVFQFAGSRPTVLLFDEFDAIGKSRSDAEEHGELKRVVNSFLQLLDGFRGETLTIAATNHQGLLDSAIWRRFDEIVYFDLPSRQAIIEVLVRNLRQIGVSRDINLESSAELLMGMSHADVERAALDAVKDAVLSQENMVTSNILAEAICRQLERVTTSGQRPTKRKNTLRVKED